jgi:hypothetical protein
MLEPTHYAAEETLVVTRGSTPLANDAAAHDVAATIRTLGDSHVVTSNVARALRSSEGDVRDRTSVSRIGDTAALRVHGEATSPAAAVQLVQEYGLVLGELVRSRLGPVGLVPFDPAHARGGRVSPHWARNVVWGGILGAVAGLAAGVLLPPRPAGPTAPAEPPVPVAEPAPPARSPAPSRPNPEPEPERAPEPRAEPPAPGSWSLGELRRRVEAARTAHPERVAEWDTYLELLAEQEIDGVLPRGLDPLIDEVFGSRLY